MTIQQLEYTVALANRKNFVKAAEKCFVTQPTLTMQIQKLEEEIGFLIFDRTKKPVKITKLGAEFIEGARLVINNVQNLKTLINNEKENIKGEFRVGIIPTIAPYLVALFLPDFIKQYPDSKLVIEEVQSTDMINYLKQDLLDVGILSGPVNEPNIKEVKLYSEPFLVYFSDKSELANQPAIRHIDLEPEQLLLLSEGHCFRNQTLNICSENFIHQQEFTYNSGSLESVMALVDKDMGYTLIPELLVLKRKSMQNTKRFIRPEPAREIVLASNTTYHRYSFLENLHKSIIKNLPEHIKKSSSINHIKWR